MILSKVDAQASPGAHLSIIDTRAIRVDMYKAQFVRLELVASLFSLPGVLIGCGPPFQAVS